MDIGGKKEAREREKKWEQKNDQAGEKLLKELIKFNKKEELGGKKSNVGFETSAEKVN